MIRFFRNIAAIYQFWRIICSYQIISHNDENIKLTKGIKLFLYFLIILTHPLSLIRKPSDKFGQRLTSAFYKLGPIYIKLGQSLSTRSDIVGLAIASELEKLQDKLPAFDIQKVQDCFIQTFGKTVDDIFDEFDPKPIAAASIAQVHKAKLNNQFVAVKILRPDIYKKYQQDIQMLEFIAKILEKISKKMRRLRPVAVIQIFSESMENELNLTFEAAAANKIRQNLKNETNINIPRIFWQYTTNNILTTSWIDGVSAAKRSDIEKLKIDPDIIAKNIAICFFNMAFRDGFFHADLHPGNILVQKNGDIALIDFGITCNLPDKDRFAIAQIVYALVQRDYDSVAKLHKKIGYIPQDTCLTEFAMCIASISEPIFELPTKDISIGRLLSVLFQTTEKYGMQTQPQLVMIQKTILMVEGVGKELDPNINIWQLAEPWIRKWAAKNLSTEAKLMRAGLKLINKILNEV